MSTPSGDAVRAEADAGAMKIGNSVRTAAGAVAFTNITQLSTDASGNLRGTDSVSAHQPTAASQMFTLRGNGASGILTNTLVLGADVTTATIGGYLRTNLTNNGTGLATGDYYLPVYTIV